MSAELPVDVIPSPFRTERVRCTAPLGSSLQEIIGLGRLENYQIHAVVNGVSIERQHWARTVPGLSDRVTVTVVPQGRGGGSNPIAVIATIALAVVAPFAGAAVAGALGVTGTVGTLVSAGVSAAIVAGGAGIINHFVAAPVPKLTQGAQTPQTFGISGIRNSLPSRYQSVLSLFGTHRLFPFFAARPYSTAAGLTQFLHVLYDCGYGPLERPTAADLRIGSRPISEFSEVTWSFHDGEPGEDSRLAQFSKRHFQEVVSSELKASEGWRLFTSPTSIDRATVGILFPQGLARVNRESGALETVHVLIQIQTQDEDGNWQSPATSVQVERASFEAWWVSTEITFAARGQHTWRIRRVTGNSSENNVRDVSQLAFVDYVNDDPPVMAQGRALLALSIRATGQLHGTLDSFSGVFSRKLPTWDGTDWTEPKVTNSVAWAAASILRGPGNADPVPDAMVDGEFFKALDEYCTGRGYTFNGVFDNRESVWEALTDILACGRCAPTVLDGSRFSGIVDRKRTVPVDLITPRDSSQFRGSKTWTKFPDAIVAVYRDASDRSWDAKEITVYDTGKDASNARDIRRLELFGTTNMAEAHKRVRYIMAEARLRPEEFEVTLDVKNLAVTRGDYVDLIHDVPLVGLGAARIKRVALGDGGWHGFDLDAEIPLEAGQRHNVRIQGLTGEVILAEIQDGNVPVTIPGQTVSGEFQ